MKNLLLLLLFILISTGTAFAQNGVIRGEVFDDNGLLPGVDISVSDVSTRISTDADGAFAIKLKPGKYDFHFRFPQYNNADKIVTIEVGEIEDIEVEMTQGEQKSENLNQVEHTQMQLDEFMRNGQQMLTFLKTMVFRVK